jgi:signal transduction histidine kinase/sugar lactone lactonase YvrE
MISPPRQIAITACLLALAAIFLPAAAQEISGAPFLIRSWQTDAGLPNNTVNAVAQTCDGYLWLGTDAGLARFDGVRCRVFGLQDGLPGLQISALLEDRHGTLWIGTAGGGLCRKKSDGAIETFTIKDGLAGNAIQALIEATNGDLWVGTPAGLSCWHTNHFEPVARQFGTMYVTDLAKDQQGGIWVATLHQELLRFQDENHFTTNHPTGMLRTGYFSPRCVMVDGQNRVWVGSRNKCIYCYDAGKWSRYGTNEGLPEIILNHLAQTLDGTIWAASLNEGLYYLRDGKFNALQRKDGLSDDAMLSLFSDQQFLWAGTQSGGLCRIGPKKLSVQHPMEGLSECQLRSFAETTNGEVWLGTYGQGIYRWQEGGMEQLAGTPWQDHVIVEALLGGQDGSLWWGAGPSLYQWKDGSLLNRNEDRQREGDRIWCLCEDYEGGVWVGTYNGLLQHFKGKKITNIKGLPAQPLTALVQETNGTLWIGSLGGGLGRLQNGRLAVFTAKDGLQSDLIRCLRLDADGSLWIGTDGGGLNHFANGKFNSFTTQQGLPENNILQILEDDDGSLWLGGNHGICRVSKRVLEEVAAGKTAQLHVANFGNSEGMASEQCIGNFGAAIKTRTGQLYFATAKGFVILDPRRQTHVVALPLVLLEDVLVDRKSVNSVAGEKTFALKIPPGRHSLDFRFTGIGFDAPEKIQFRYRLEDHDYGWTEWSEVRQAHYSDLPPGNYRFRVQAANSNGQWQEPGTGFSFEVQPYLWQTLWFKIASLAVLVGLLGSVIRLIERRRYRARLKRMEQERAMENERVRIARDLHDELGSSLTYISMSISDIGQSPETNAEKLKARVEKISTFATRTARALDEIVWAVNPRNDSLRSLVEYLSLLARELFENTEVHCRFQIADDLPEVPLPPEIRHHLFLVVKEALANALKHSRATEILFGAKTDGDRFEICLQDNGVGFDVAAAGQGERNGLKNMRQRIESLGGRFVADSRPGGGTTIRIALKYPSVVKPPA